MKAAFSLEPLAPSYMSPHAVIGPEMIDCDLRGRTYLADDATIWIAAHCYLGAHADCSNAACACDCHHKLEAGS